MYTKNYFIETIEIFNVKSFKFDYAALGEGLDKKISQRFASFNKRKCDFPSF